MTWDPKDIHESRSCLTKMEIKAYLAKSTSKHESFEMENHMLDCELCRDALEGYTQHPNGLNNKDSKTKSYSFKSWLAIAAGLIILVLGGLAVHKYQIANQHNSIFAQFYQKPNWDNQTRGAASSSELNEAVQNYNQGLYQAAVPSFDSLLNSKEDNNQMRLFKGIAHLEMNEFSQAEEELNTVRINSDVYFEEASWYLALLKIKTENLLEAKAYLDELIELENSFYRDRALEMKNRLQK